MRKRTQIEFPIDYACALGTSGMAAGWITLKHIHYRCVRSCVMSHDNFDAKMHFWVKKNTIWGLMPLGFNHSWQGFGGSLLYFEATYAWERIPRENCENREPELYCYYVLFCFSNTCKSWIASTESNVLQFGLQVKNGLTHNINMKWS